LLYCARTGTLPADLPPRRVSPPPVCRPPTPHGNHGRGHGGPEHGDHQRTSDSSAPAPPPAAVCGHGGASKRLRSVQRESLRHAEHLFASLLRTAFVTG
jgi:hypothetical protein